MKQNGVREFLQKGCEQNENEVGQEPGNVVAKHLAHCVRPNTGGQHTNSIHRYYTGCTCYREWYFHPNWSVSRLV